MRASALLLSAALTVLALACAEKASDAPRVQSSVSKCIPNQTLVCVCDLDEGTQRCTETHELTPCSCLLPRPADDGGTTRPDNPGPTPDAGPQTRCGDGHVDPGEACDDGNARDGDGCSTQCKPDGAPLLADTCPGQSVTVWKGSSVVLAGSNEGYTDDFGASCYTADGPDRVYAIHASDDGFLSIDSAFAAGFNAVVELRAGACDFAAARPLCEPTFSRPFKRIVQVKKDTTYYLVVDGDGEAAEGAFTIRLELP